MWLSNPRSQCRNGAEDIFVMRKNGSSIRTQRLDRLKFGAILKSGLSKVAPVPPDMSGFLGHRHTNYLQLFVASVTLSLHNTDNTFAIHLDTSFLHTGNFRDEMLLDRSTHTHQHKIVRTSGVAEEKRGTAPHCHFLSRCIFSFAVPILEVL